MEPLKPEKVKDLLDQPAVAHADIEEYERLLAERFTRDPNLPGPATGPAQPRTAQHPSEVRLEELYKKLFPGGHQP